MNETVFIVMPNFRPTSWNPTYAGRFWKERSDEKDRVAQLVRAYLPAEVLDGKPVFDVPVTISVDVFVINHPMDADNVADKYLIDALKDWVIADDDITHVSRVSTAVFIDRENPRTEITIMPTRRP